MGHVAAKRALQPGGLDIDALYEGIRRWGVGLRGTAMDRALGVGGAVAP
jgi:hypothetical protein